MQKTLFPCSYPPQIYILSISGMYAYFYHIHPGYLHLTYSPCWNTSQLVCFLTFIWVLFLLDRFVVYVLGEPGLQKVYGPACLTLLPLHSFSGDIVIRLTKWPWSTKGKIIFLWVLFHLFLCTNCTGPSKGKLLSQFHSAEQVCTKVAQISRLPD